MLPLFLAGSSFLGGLAKRKAAWQTAAAERKTAIAEYVSGRLRERSGKRQQEALLSTIAARAGAAGLDVSQGSAMRAYLDAARETELEILAARKATDADFGARLNAAREFEASGNSALVGDTFRGFESFLIYDRKRRAAGVLPARAAGND